MPSKDPLTHLSVDCAALVFRFLSIQDISRCQRVSRAWRECLDAWIAASGLRLNFPEHVAPGKISDPSLAVQKFKDLCALDIHLRRGIVVGVQRYPHARLFTTAGDYAAWFELGKGVFTECLNQRKSGSPQASRRLDIPHSPADSSRVCHLGLNIEGYLHIRFVRSSTNPNTWQEIIQGYQDIVLSVTTGKQIWARYQAATGTPPGPPDIPIIIGRDRAYFATANQQCQMFFAHDFRTGKRLPYQIPTMHPMPIPAAETAYYFNHIQKTRLLPTKDGELLIHCRGADIQIMNGDTGRCIQHIKTQVIGGEHVYLVTAPATRSFAVVSHEDIRRRHIMIQKFTQRSNSAEFVETGLDIVWTSDTPEVTSAVAVDPFREVVASLWGMTTPVLAAFEELHPRVRHEVNTVLEQRGVTKPVDRYLFAPGMERLVLRHGKNWRQPVNPIPGPPAFRTLFFWGRLLVAYDYIQGNYAIDFGRPRY